MNSGTTSTELNDMLTNFVDYVDSFYGQNDPLYPMMSQETKQPLTKFDILRATETILLSVVMKMKLYALGVMVTR